MQGYRERTAHLCRHCGLKRPNRPRLLCWTCYHTPGVRGRYAPVGKYARRGVAIGNPAGRLPAEPTATPPGPNKVAVLKERARLGLALFHPLDARLSCD